MKANKLTYTFHNGDLQSHAVRIIENFKTNPDNYGDESMMPKKAYISDNGEGDEYWWLDTPNIEESYFYGNEKERDEDYNNLMQALDLILQLN